MNESCYPKGISIPKYVYEFQIGGDFGLRVMVTKEQVPNWFHRKMQTLILGIKWRKL